MATLNLVLDTRRARKDGTFPLTFRIRSERKFSDIATGYTLNEEDFDKKTSTISNDLVSNEQLDELKSHYIKRLRAYMVANVGRENIKDMRAYLVNKLPDEITIIEFWKEQIESLLTAGRNGGAKVHQTSLSVLSQESDLNIPFSKFSYRDLLTLESNLYKRGLSVNGMGVYLRSFRSICNLAINFDLVGYEWYPFRKYKIRKEKTTPRILSQDELKRYFSLELEPGHSLYKSWQIGKLIFMLRGINITDLLLLSSDNIKGDRIIYKRAKTGKIYSIRILDEVTNILASLEDKDSLVEVLNKDELNSGFKLINIITMRRKVINNHLKKIGLLINSREPITTYVFRYSYSNVAKQLGYSKDLIAEALGHEYGNSVTGIYLEQFDLEIVDEMNEQIVKQIMGERAL